MELMSSLLFCVLVAHLPQALGDNQDSKPTQAETELTFNNSIIINQMRMLKKDLLNTNGLPLVNMVNDLQIILKDLGCQNCINCTERALETYNNYVTKTQTRTDKLYEGVFKNRIDLGKRSKRDTATTDGTVSQQKRTKSKKKNSKSVTVTKYNDHGEVYALKVKETNIQVNGDNDTQVSTCQIYKVKKSSPCDTPEGDSFLTVSKKKTSKKNKKDKDNTKGATTTSTVKTHFLAPAYRKRQVDNSQVPENFMPSIEEMY